MLIKGVSQYVGPDKLSLLSFIEPNFIKANRESQYFYFDKSCWYITKDTVQEIGYEGITHHIWEEQRKGIPAKYLGKPLITFEKEGDGYNYRLSIKAGCRTSSSSWSTPAISPGANSPGR